MLYRIIYYKGFYTIKVFYTIKFFEAAVNKKYYLFFSCKEENYKQITWLSNMGVGDATYDGI